MTVLSQNGSGSGSSGDDEPWGYALLHDELLLLDDKVKGNLVQAHAVDG